MDNTQTNTSYWVASAIILVLLVVGISLWYSAMSSNTPGTPNTGAGATDQTYQTDTVNGQSTAPVN